MKIITQILNVIYCLIIILFLLDSLTSFDIKSQSIKSFVYFGLIFETPFVLFWNFLVIKTKSLKIMATVFSTSILILILVVGPMNILFSNGAWRTQTVLYKHGHLSFKTIEFQIQDLGAFGYNKRKVEVFYLTPFFMITSEIPSDIDNKVEWIKIDKDVNELGLKGG